MPKTVDLYTNYPNPFNPSTTIDFWLPSPSHVHIDVVNLIGQLVEVLLDDNHEAGYHSVIWEAAHFSSGVYFYRLEADGSVQSKKMMLLN